jgi:hypothetical protein
MTEHLQEIEPKAWHVLVCGLPLSEDILELGTHLSIRRLVNPLSVFDLAAVGALGFREWATLEPFTGSATAEIISLAEAEGLQGYDPLNRCWLASALLVLRGFARHLCPAVSAYSWNLIAGHQAQTSGIFREQMIEEGVENAVYRPRRSLPSFHGGLLDYHLKLLLPKKIKSEALDVSEAKWCQEHFEEFNRLAHGDERFRFALEAATDWRYAKDPRAAIARIWAGIESLFGINSELVYRVSLFTSTIMSAERGVARIEAYRHAKSIYGIRSKAVHGEPLSDEKLIGGLHESFEILRTILLDCVSRGQVRKEDDYMLELLGR